jgi:hypothetical protein
METRSVVVGNGEFDPRASTIRSGKFDANTWGWTITPVDVYGNLFGPDYANRLQIKIDNGDLKLLRDIGNGSYQLTITARPGRTPFLSLGMDNELWFEGKLEE